MNIWEKLDSFFEERKKLFILVLPVLAVLVFIFVYVFIYSAALKFEKYEKKQFEISKKEHMALQKEFNHLKKTIVLLSKDIENNKKMLVSLNSDENYYGRLVDLLDFVRFDKYKWANFVKSIVKDAKIKKLHLQKISSKIYDINTTSVINKEMDVRLKLKGSYKNFLFFIYGYENRKDLIRIKDMNLTPNDYDITFSLYGTEK